MGYCTRYILTTSDTDINHEYNISKQINYFPFEDFCKWYEHERDMKKYSKQYPDVLFTLDCEGEEPGDTWIKYFKNGKMQECKATITFAPFNENELK